MTAQKTAARETSRHPCHAFAASMWHDLRNGIIMRNTIYAGNKLAEERVFDAADSDRIHTTTKQQIED